jgi:outer membrane protein OmpA-like peptidoglycan-associated protein
MRNPRIKIIILSVIVIPIALACMATAQEPDAENCKDHPLLSRMKNYYIGECEKNFDAVEFIVEDESVKTLEGQKTFIRYYLQENAQQPSPLQIRRNYLNAVKSLGGTALYDRDYEATFKLVKSGKEIWVKLQVWNDGNDYGLTILEIEGMAQEVTADAMYAAITKDGFMALYINFDTGKADIKPESLSIIGQIVALLKAHEDLHLSIEGHTDNVGTPAGNKTLSEQRARSVVNAVVKQGIDAGRLTAVGWGQEKPVADNRTEEGRAKNRRVEIVKK